MPRPKGSKNKPKGVGNDLDVLNAQIIEKLNEKSALEQEEKALVETIAESKVRLRKVKMSLKKLDKNIAALESMREEMGKAKEREVAMQELQPKVDALLASGKTIDEIVDMLSQ